MQIQAHLAAGEPRQLQGRWGAASLRIKLGQVSIMTSPHLPLGRLLSGFSRYLDSMETQAFFMNLAIRSQLSAKNKAWRR